MPKGFGIDFGWCGFGAHAGPPRVYRFGFVTLLIFPDGIEAVFRSYRVALMVKREEVTK